METFTVIDLCYGLGGATQYLKDEGHRVFSVDNNSKFDVDLIADVRELTKESFPFKPYFMWASPPCVEFSRCDMPWLVSKEPDMSIVLACIRLIKELTPTYWVLENVRGARPYLNPLLGKPKKCGPYFLWGQFPIFDTKVTKKKKWITAPTQKARSAARAKIPYGISKALGMALEAVHD